MSSWFDTARLGMFVHWGHVSQQGIELSWPLVGGVAALPRCPAVPVARYHASAVTFNPRAYDPSEWAGLAKAAGMRYAVLTAKHHDGYAMFDTRHSEYSVMRSPYGRDIVAQFVDAMRAAGLRVGLYYSLSDWSHPDYPAFSDEDRPYRLPWGKPAVAERWPRYVEYMFAQVRELLTNYGRIDVLWFDGGWERTPEQWRAAELMAMVRSLQPDILVNDRLPGFGDFATPEQFVPHEPLGGPWEVCLTLNESWGYNAGDTGFKPVRQIIHTLCEVAGRGGNLLLNVSPMGDGRLQPEAAERLEALAAWMSRNGDGITGTAPGLEPWQFYGPSARRGDRLYLHLLMRPYDAVTVRGVRTKRVRTVRSLSTGEELPFTTRCSIVDRLVNPDPLGELTIAAPESAIDPYATVLAADFDGPPV